MDRGLEEALERGDAITLIGAPGTGKTTSLVEIAERLPARSLLVICPSRGEADLMRDRLSARIAEIRPGPLARTPHGLAFGIVSAVARAAGQEDVRYLSGADQDAVLADLLAGHAVAGTGPEWPAELGPGVRGSAAFRTELRDLLGRVSEHALTADDLRAAARTGRPIWAACADLLEEYESVTALEQSPRLDSASLMIEAAGLIRLDRLAGLAQELPRHVLVDGAQDLTPAAGVLLDALAARGSQIIVAGCPEAVTQGFRGADGEVLRSAASSSAPRFAVGGRGHERIVLHRVHRHGGAIAAFSRDLARRIAAGPVRGVPHWEASPAAEPSEIRCLRPRSAVEEALRIARLLRGRARELEASGSERPWAGLAVVGRSTGALERIRRELLAQRIPVGDRLPATALRDHPATAPLLTALGWIEAEPSADEVEEVLRSPLGGHDAISLRRLRRRLLARDRAAAPDRGVPGEAERQRRWNELLLSAVTDRGRAQTTGDAGVLRIAGLHHGARAAVDDDLVAALDRIWTAAGVADAWRTTALADDPGSAEDREIAQERLDCVLRLFALAEKLVEHDPGLGIQSFLARVAEQEIAQDSLALSGVRLDAVTLTTVAAIGDRQWDTVVIPQLQEGSWPNLTVRGALLGPDELVQEVRRPGSGPGDDPRERSAWAQRARRQVFRDEAGMLLSAVGRATRLVIASAVDGAEEAPGVLFGELERCAVDGEVDTEEARREQLRPLTLRGMVGRLRSELRSSPEESVAEERAAILGMLSDLGVPGADPRQWRGLAGLSTEVPPRIGEVRISPSDIERFETCPLDWFLSRHGGQDGFRGHPATLGTVVHRVAEELPRAGEAELLDRFDALCADLDGDEDWELARAIERGRTMMSHLAGFQSARSDRFLGSEVPVSVGLRVGDEAFRIAGIMDRVDRHPDGGLEVIDYKTGRANVSGPAAQTSGQLLAYQLAVHHGRLVEGPEGPRLVDAGEGETGEVSHGASLVQLLAGTPEKMRIASQDALQDPEAIATAEQRMAAVAAGMRGPFYRCSPSRSCPRCHVIFSTEESA